MLMRIQFTKMMRIHNTVSCDTNTSLFRASGSIYIGKAAMDQVLKSANKKGITTFCLEHCIQVKISKSAYFLFLDPCQICKEKTRSGTAINGLKKLWEEIKCVGENMEGFLSEIKQFWPAGNFFAFGFVSWI